MTRQIRAYGRNQIALHLPVDFPHVDLLRQAALFFNTYSKGGEIVAYDLVFPLRCRHWLRAILERIEETVMDRATRNGLFVK